MGKNKNLAPKHLEELREYAEEVFFNLNSGTDQERRRAGTTLAVLNRLAVLERQGTATAAALDELNAELRKVLELEQKAQRALRALREGA